jgi:hypothetical protein
VFTANEDVRRIERVVTLCFVERKLSREVRKYQSSLSPRRMSVSAAITGAASRCIGGVSAVGIPTWNRLIALAHSVA